MGLIGLIVLAVVGTILIGLVEEARIKKILYALLLIAVLVGALQVVGLIDGYQLWRINR